MNIIKLFKYDTNFDKWVKVDKFFWDEIEAYKFIDEANKTLMHYARKLRIKNVKPLRFKIVRY